MDTQRRIIRHPSLFKNTRSPDEEKEGTNAFRRKIKVSRKTVRTKDGVFPRALVAQPRNLFGAYFYLSISRVSPSSFRPVISSQIIFMTFTERVKKKKYKKVSFFS